MAGRQRVEGFFARLAEKTNSMGALLPAGDSLGGAGGHQPPVKLRVARVTDIVFFGFFVSGRRAGGGGSEKTNSRVAEARVWGVAE
jgi:hypothetical protein